ncbi:MAG: HAMP domain-containing sensor histidine kinase [Desulfonatronovibrio sp.]
MDPSNSQVTLLKLENQELKAKIKQKDRLIKVMAHDLKAPLLSFLGFTEYMSEDLENFSTEELKIIMQDMNQHARGMYDLVQNLLYWDKTSNQFKPVKFSVNEEIASNFKAIEPMARQKKIHINIILPENDSVFADRQMTASMLRNLLSNAIKHTPSGGKIDVTAMKQNKMLQITVKDYGYGMDNKTLDHLLNPEKAGAKGSATGLGLLICKKFVEQNKGKIWGESSRGQGTSFHFTLPLAD